MRISFALPLALFLPASGMTDTPAIIERGLNHRVWQSIQQRLDPNGATVLSTNRVTEVATGMHFWSQGQLTLAAEHLEVFERAAVGRSAGPQVIFSPNINQIGAVDFLSRSGQRFVSHVIGLSLYDEELDQVVFIAAVKDSIGQILPGGQIVYPDAFDGVRADIRYSYRRYGISQDILIREALPFVPEDFGFSSDSTRLEVTTEFIQVGEPTKHVRAVDGMGDENLRFGPLSIGPGKAFDMGTRSPSVPVAKRWTTIDNRTFLIEAVYYPSIKPYLTTLPPSDPQAAVKKPAAAQIAALQGRQIPKLIPGKIDDATVQLASAPLSGKALLLDYTLAEDGGELILRGDETVYVSGKVLVTNLVIQAGTVVKFSNSASIEVSVDGAVDSQALPYLPAIFTARDDATVGEVIGTNTLNGQYADPALELHDGQHLLQHIRFSHAREAIRLDDGNITLNHCQIVDCGNALNLTGAEAYLNNVLIHSVTNVVLGSSSPKLFAQHLTVHEAAELINNADQTASGSLTNSLLVELDSWGDIVPATNTVQIATSSSVFQTIGAGSHYLPVNSPYRGAGTTNISATLAADLRQRTTDAPVLLEERITLDTTLTRQTRTNPGQPTIGYHYPALDYLLDIVEVTNATVTIQPGVALASYNYAGFWCTDNSTLLSLGTATRPVRITRSYSVQEGTVDRGSIAGTISVSTWHSAAAPAAVRLRFTDLTIPAAGGYHLYSIDTGWEFNALELKDCRIGGGAVYLERTVTGIYGTTNCLLVRVDFQTVLAPQPSQFYNNLFLAGGYFLWPTTNACLFYDNLLDGSAVMNLSADLGHDYNAFHQSTAFHSIYGANGHELILTNLSYDSGAMGGHYQPATSPLINAGSLTNAGDAGLYHYTTTTNQYKEANSIVDIGIHFVAVDANGEPVDTDADGVPDYLEDVNGNGTHDAGETDWETYDSLQGIGSGPGLVLFTPLK